MPRSLPDTGKFVIRVGDNLVTYNDWRQIPSSFDNLISFEPDYIPPPHAEGEHELNEIWPERFKQILKRETR